MYRKKILALPVLLLLALEPFFTVLPFWSLHETPLYKDEAHQATLQFKAVPSASAANGKTLFSALHTYSATGAVHFSQAQETVAFSLDKTTLSAGASVSLIYNGKKIPVSFEEDGGDERILLEKNLNSNPLFFDSIQDVRYEVTLPSKPSAPIAFFVRGIAQDGKTQTLVFNPPFIQTQAADDVKVVSRSGWGANEMYRYEDSPLWISIYKNLENVKQTAWQIAQALRVKNTRTYLLANFAQDNTPVETITSDNGHPLVWPVKKTQFVKKIVVHHTADTNVSQKSDEEIMRNTFYYHSVTNGWGDIGYNYIIGHDGTIFEGRAGGDYAIGAHAVWNNESTVGISVMGNYENATLNEAQQNALTSLTTSLSKKYGINLNTQVDSHKECKTGVASCLLIDFKTPSLVGHKDVGYTSCPGKNLYPLLDIIRQSATNTDLSYVAYSASSSAVDSNTASTTITLAKWPLVRIRLSYPITQKSITIRSNSSNPMKLNIGKRNGTLPSNVEMQLSTYKNNQIVLKYGKKRYLLPNIRLSAAVLKISSWERIPTWDTTKTTNDNLFRGTLEIDSESGSLVVINELPLEDYLKGLAEISNGDNTEKVRTILVAARSYAYFYSLSENRKFPGKNYDGSDDPDVFQKYLGYNLEKRSPNVAAQVDYTNGTVVTYADKPIKPWYFNQSDGLTRSYKQYCEIRVKEGSLPKTTVCEEVPYLQSQSDPGCVGRTRLGHGVWISGAGATYLATTLDFTYAQIIQYYLAGTQLKKIY